MLYKLTASPSVLKKSLYVFVPAVLLIVGLFLAIWLQSPAQAGPPIVGIAPNGRNAYEFVGRVDQNAANFVGYGYMTFIRGLNPGQLFSNPLLSSEATAHFTYYTTATLFSRAVISGVFALDTVGYTTYYYHPTAGVNFSNRGSFATGTPIGTAVIRYHDVLNVQGPNVGIATGVGEVDQTSALSFTIGGQSYQFGESGLLTRVSTTGEGTRTDAAAPKSFVVMAGYGIVASSQDVFLPNVRSNTP